MVGVSSNQSTQQQQKKEDKKSEVPDFSLENESLGGGRFLTTDGSLGDQLVTVDAEVINSESVAAVPRSVVTDEAITQVKVHLDKTFSSVEFKGLLEKGVSARLLSQAFSAVVDTLSTTNSEGVLQIDALKDAAGVTYRTTTSNGKGTAKELYEILEVLKPAEPAVTPEGEQQNSRTVLFFDPTKENGLDQSAAGKQLGETAEKLRKFLTHAALNLTTEDVREDSVRLRTATGDAAITLSDIDPSICDFLKAALGGKRASAEKARGSKLEKSLNEKMAEDSVSLADIPATEVRKEIGVRGTGVSFKHSSAKLARGVSESGGVQDSVTIADRANTTKLTLSFTSIPPFKPGEWKSEAERDSRIVSEQAMLVKMGLKPLDSLASVLPVDMRNEIEKKLNDPALLDVVDLASISDLNAARRMQSSLSALVSDYHVHQDGVDPSTQLGVSVQFVESKSNQPVAQNEVEVAASVHKFLQFNQDPDASLAQTVATSPGAAIHSFDVSYEMGMCHVEVGLRGGGVARFRIPSLDVDGVGPKNRENLRELLENEFAAEQARSGKTSFAESKLFNILTKEGELELLCGGSEPLEMKNVNFLGMSAAKGLVIDNVRFKNSVVDLGAVDGAVIKDCRFDNTALSIWTDNSVVNNTHFKGGGVLGRFNVVLQRGSRVGANLMNADISKLTLDADTYGGPAKFFSRIHVGGAFGGYAGLLRHALANASFRAVNPSNGKVDPDLLPPGYAPNLVVVKDRNGQVQENAGLERLLTSKRIFEALATFEYGEELNSSFDYAREDFAGRGRSFSKRVTLSSRQAMRKNGEQLSEYLEVYGSDQDLVVASKRAKGAVESSNIADTASLTRGAVGLRAYKFLQICSHLHGSNVPAPRNYASFSKRTAAGVIQGTPIDEDDNRVIG